MLGVPRGERCRAAVPHGPFRSLRKHSFLVKQPENEGIAAGSTKSLICGFPKTQIQRRNDE